MAPTDPPKVKPTDDLSKETCKLQSSKSCQEQKISACLGYSPTGMHSSFLFFFFMSLSGRMFFVYSDSFWHVIYIAWKSSPSFTEPGNFVTSCVLLILSLHFIILWRRLVVTHLLIPDLYGCGSVSRILSKSLWYGWTSKSLNILKFRIQNLFRAKNTKAVFLIG